MHRQYTVRRNIFVRVSDKSRCLHSALLDDHSLPNIIRRQSFEDNKISIPMGDGWYPMWDFVICAIANKAKHCDLSSLTFDSLTSIAHHRVVFY